METNGTNLKIQDMISVAKPATIDEYIAGFPKEVQQLLEQIRATIKAAAPGAEEAIKYAIPTFILNGNLIHFAGYKNHIGIYPAPVAIEKFQKELAMYKQSKGTIQLPLDKLLPLDLITKITKFRVQQLSEKRVGKKQSIASKGLKN